MRIQGRASGSRCPVAPVAVLVLLVAPAPVVADQVFYDRAAVTAVTPIEETVRRPVTEERCETIVPRRDPARIAAWVGDVRAQAPGITLVDALREDRSLFLERSLPEQRCRRVTVMHEQRAPVSYRVEYRYGGRTFVRRMSEHPGEWVRVRVRMGEVR